MPREAEPHSNTYIWSSYREQTNTNIKINTLQEHIHNQIQEIMKQPNLVAYTRKTSLGGRRHVNTPLALIKVRFLCFSMLPEPWKLTQYKKEHLPPAFDQGDIDVIKNVDQFLRVIMRKDQFNFDGARTMADIPCETFTLLNTDKITAAVAKLNQAQAGHHDEDIDCESNINGGLHVTQIY
ncbi:hypothetical protein VP01_7531g1 [Puccinia sorghi]|uniref:Uncharacterized protein n=1 Tax=Puccinia sorghi TaxID=27349 RepID=A0A0L6UC27_9BASI|nr:hypothetical protein VP01_7531g1 [Puccinia sorghi]